MYYSLTIVTSQSNQKVYLTLDQTGRQPLLMSGIPLSLKTLRTFTVRLGSFKLRPGGPHGESHHAELARRDSRMSITVIIPNVLQLVAVFKERR